jgi:hypothetical protein
MPALIGAFSKTGDLAQSHRGPHAGLVGTDAAAAAAVVVVGVVVVVVVVLPHPSAPFCSDKHLATVVAVA